MRHEVVTQTVNSHPTIYEAAYKLLFKWLRSQNNRTIAYENLCKALRSVNLNLFVNELTADGENRVAPPSAMFMKEDDGVSEGYVIMSSSVSQVRNLERKRLVYLCLVLW